MVQRLLRVPLLPLLAGTKPAGTKFRRASRVTGRLVAAPNQIQPVRGAKLPAAELQVRGLRFSNSANASVEGLKYWFNPFKSFPSTFYDIQSRLLLREGFSDDKVLQSMIDDMKKTTKVQRDVKVGDVLDLTFVKKANEELKASSWKP